MRHRLLFLLFSFFLLSPFVSSSIAKSKLEPSLCEKQCHAGFSAQQRQQLCEGVPSKSVGPAACSSLAKSDLHLQFDKIIGLCKGAASAAPSACYQSLSAKHRNSIGISLCSHAMSNFPAVCFSQLSSLRGLKNESYIIDFCRRHAIDDNIAPVDCTMASVQDYSIPPHIALTACNNAVSSANTLNCLRDLQVVVSPSVTGLKPLDIVSLCASSPSTDEKGGDLLKSQFENIVTKDSIKDVLSPVGRCILAVFNVTSRDGALQSNPGLSATQRSQLCTGAPADGLGPAVCALHAYIIQRSQSLGLKSDEIVELCTGALSQGAVSCFSESRGLGSNTQRIELCQGASGSV